MFPATPLDLCITPFPGATLTHPHAHLQSIWRASSCGSCWCPGWCTCCTPLQSICTSLPHTYPTHWFAEYMARLKLRELLMPRVVSQLDLPAGDATNGKQPTKVRKVRPMAFLVLYSVLGDALMPID